MQASKNDFMRMRAIGRGAADDSDDNYRSQHLANLEAVKQSDNTIGNIMQMGAEAGLSM